MTPLPALLLPACKLTRIVWHFAFCHATTAKYGLEFRSFQLGSLSFLGSPALMECNDTLICTASVVLASLPHPLLWRMLRPSQFNQYRPTPWLSAVSSNQIYTHLEASCTIIDYPCLLLINGPQALLSICRTTIICVLLRDSLIGSRSERVSCISQFVVNVHGNGKKQISIRSLVDELLVEKNRVTKFGFSNDERSSWGSLGWLRST